MRALLILLLALAAVAVAVALWPAAPPSPHWAPPGRAQRAVPGAPLRLVLGAPAAAAYGAATAGPDPWGDATLAALGLPREPGFDHAARELARAYAREEALLPGDALQFILDSAGAAAWGVRQTVVVTGAPDPEAVARALRAELDEAGIRAGIGRAPTPDGKTAVALISGLVELELAPVSRAPPAGQPLTIAGRRLTPGSLRALAMGPGGGFLEPEVTRDGEGFALSLVPEPGEWIVELLGEGPHGPAPLAQLSFFVGGAPPLRFETRWPADPSPVDAAAAAALIQADRAAAGLPPLILDDTLSAAAQAHSEEMRARRFVGHRSPTTGRPSDRVRAAGYAAAIVAENVAFNRSLADAQAGLMRSLGHRRNLLSAELTALGVGLVAGDDGWYLTQLFARPRPVLADPDGAARDLVHRLSAASGRAMRRSADLDRLARAEAQALAPSPQRLLDAAAAAGLQGRLTAWVATLALLEQFEPPVALRDERFARIGVGVHQRQDLAGPDIQVVMLLAD